MKGLKFGFDEMLREVNGFFIMAKGFLDPSAESCLRGFADRLGAIRSAAPLKSDPATERAWVIPESQPLLTLPSRDYEKGSRKGALEICGRITSKWVITPEHRKNNLDTPKHFYLTGNASVRVELIDVKTHEAMGSWRMEIADDAAPGCYFHIQILGEEVEPPFPHSVTIPRLPCIATTPMAVLEFVLGELFQDRWESHSRNSTPEMESWRSVQRRRLLNLLSWQQDLIRQGNITPWTTLKTAKPSQDLLLKSHD